MLDELILYTSDILSGFGLFALLEFSRLSPYLNSFNTICIFGVVIAIVIAIIIHLYRKNTPPWLRLCNATVSLVMTLSVCLNLLSQLCPPSGKELCLIPCYVLLCMPRMTPSKLAVGVLSIYTLLLFSAFCLLPTSKYSRPSDTDSVGWDAILSLGLHVIISTSFHSQLLSIHQDSIWQTILAALSKGIMLLIIGAKCDTSIYNFMYEGGRVSNQITAAYGILLLFHSMLTAAVWFSHLRDTLGIRADMRIISRIQHIFYALLVAAAWAFPLQLTGLRVILAVGLITINIFY